MKPTLRPLRPVIASAVLAGLTVTPYSEAKTSAAGPEAAGMSAEKLAEIDAVVEKMIDDQKLVGCVVAVARKGKIAYFKPFGMMEAGGEDPMAEDTIFRIYSMSKAVVTAAALMLVEDGVIALDDPVAKYLPELKGVKVSTDDGDVAAEREPTVRDLMRHTAGLTYGFFGNTEIDQQYREKNVMGGTLDEMAERLGDVPLLYQPGKKWVYSVATDVLGLVVERATKKTLDVFLDERVFEPLGMVDTGFWVPEEKLDRFSSNHRFGEDGSLTVIDSPARSRYTSKPRMLSGGGGLCSTTGDYLRFLQMIANGGALDGKRLLKEETVALMTTNQLPDEAMPIEIGTPRPGTGFGLGFSVRVADTEWDPGARVGEYGWGGAASTHYWVSPEDDDLIVVTMEQTMPFTFGLEFGLKKLIYDAIAD